MDVMGPFPTSRLNNTQVLTIQDSFTKFAVAIPMPIITAEVVMDRFLKNFVYIFGPPSRLITDRGSNFMSSKFQNMCKSLGIQHEPTLPHQKNSNGQVERLHRTIEECLTHYLKEDLTDWDSFLPKIIFALNNLCSSTTGISPYIALFGKDCRMTLDEDISTPIEGTMEDAHDAKQRAAERKILDQYIISKSEAAAKKHEDKYNQSHRTQEKSIEIGDKVLIEVKNTRPGQKLRPSYVGPAQVIQVQGSRVQIK
ncbi:unnamed protein product, partial [Auanema sp. JU1783]